MFKREFTYREDHEYGGMGWAPKHQPLFNVSEGLGVAHDALEHFSGDDETWEGEFRAFGSILWMRGVGGYFYQMNHFHPDPAYHMGHDLGRFIRDMDNQQRKLKQPPRTRPLDEEAEYILENSIQKGRESYLAEAKYDDCSVSDDELDRELNKARGWIRIGYRKAVRRFRGCDPYEAASLFKSLEKLVDQLYAEEGDKLIVRVSPSKMQFQVELRSIADEYPEDY